jgi:hypothetical protein
VTRHTPLAAQVFGAGTFAGADPAVRESPFIQQVEAAYAAAIQRDDKLAAALVNKAQVCGWMRGTLHTCPGRHMGRHLTHRVSRHHPPLQAALEHRTYRLGREAALLKARLAVARGQPASFPTEGPAEL